MTYLDERVDISRCLVKDGVVWSIEVRNVGTPQYSKKKIYLKTLICPSLISFRSSLPFCLGNPYGDGVTHTPPCSLFSFFSLTVRSPSYIPLLPVTFSTYVLSPSPVVRFYEVSRTLSNTDSFRVT